MKKVLVIAPHADDEIIGLGGTLLKHIARGDRVYICVVTRGCEPIFPKEGREKGRAESILCHQKLGSTKTFFLDFPAAMLEEIPRYELNAALMSVFNEVSPHIVYIPHFGDMQKDHTLVADAAMVCVRPKYKYKVECVYAYETLSETEWDTPHAAKVFIPQRYVDITDILERKLELLACYESQLSEFPNPRSLEAVIALAKYRGSTVGVRAAEAFSVVRIIE